MPGLADVAAGGGETLAGVSRGLVALRDEVVARLTLDGPRLSTGERDALIVDVPSCYAQGRDIAVRNGIRLVRSGGAVLCNIWCRDNVKRLLSSLGAKNVRVVRYPVKPGGSSFQYTVVFRKR